MPKRAICNACSRPCRACLCHAFPANPIETVTNFVIIQTAAEARCKVGTAWLLPHVLSNCKIITPKEVPLVMKEDTVVLFPGADSVSVETLTPQPKCVILIDGTWDSAKRLLKNSRALCDLPRAYLPSTDSIPLFRVRRPPVDVTGARSTAEATADAIDALDGELGKPAARAVRRAVHEASEMQLRFVRRKGVENVPHRTERAGYVNGLFDEREAVREEIVQKGDETEATWRETHV